MPVMGWEEMVMNGIDLITTQGKATITDLKGATKDIELTHREVEPFLKQATVVVKQDQAAGLWSTMGPCRVRRSSRCGRNQGPISFRTDCSTRIRIRNTTDQPKVLRKGTPVGSFHLQKAELITVNPAVGGHDEGATRDFV